MTTEWMAPSEMMRKYREGDEQDKLEILQWAVKAAYIPGGCLCITAPKNGWCTAHQFLWEVARDE